MAAHIKTYIDKALAIKDFDQGRFEEYHQAISYAQLRDCLDPEDWQKLYHEDEAESFIVKLKEMKPKYDAIWEKYHQPVTVEEWFAIRRGVHAIIFLQDYMGIEEPEERALNSWLFGFNDQMRESTMQAYYALGKGYYALGKGNEND